MSAMSLFAGKIARRESGAEELDRGNEREPREHAAAEQVAGDARADDVSHSRELGADLGLDLTEQLRAAAGDGALEGVLGDLEPEVKARCEELVERTETKAHEHRLGLNAALLADDEHLGARGAFGVLEVGVLLHDQAASKRNHEDDAEDAADDADRGHGRPRQVVSEKEQRGQCERDAGGDRFAGGSRRLHHVVLKNGRRRAAQNSRDVAEDGDRQNGHRNRRAHGETHLEREIHTRGGEHEPEDDPENDDAWRQFRGFLGCGYVRRVDSLVGSGRGMSHALEYETWEPNGDRACDESRERCVSSAHFIRSRRSS